MTWKHHSRIQGQRFRGRGQDICSVSGVGGGGAGSTAYSRSSTYQSEGARLAATDPGFLGVGYRHRFGPAMAASDSSSPAQPPTAR